MVVDDEHGNCDKFYDILIGDEFFFKSPKFKKKIARYKNNTKLKKFILKILNIINILVHLTHLNNVLISQMLRLEKDRNIMTENENM